MTKKLHEVIAVMMAEQEPFAEVQRVLLQRHPTMFLKSDVRRIAAELYPSFSESDLDLFVDDAIEAWTG